MAEASMFADSLLIVAHPDDDILWLGSVVDRVGGIIFCFNEDPGNPTLGKARLKTIADYPLENVTTLRLMEPQAWDKADWSQPSESASGIRLVDPQDEARYTETFERLLGMLRGRVAAARNIFTHNPWGEYGHEEHVLVHRVLRTLQQEFRFDLWYSNYCSNRSVTFMNGYLSGFDAACECLPVNLGLVRRIAAIYKRNDCWTWYDDYRWFDSEWLRKEQADTEHEQVLPYGHSFPLNYIKIHVGGSKQRPARAMRTLSRLKRRLQSATSFTINRG
jgi:hypothetical protein